MKFIMQLFFLFQVFISNAQAIKSYDYAYKNKKGIWIYSVAAKKEVLALTNFGTDPSISPDGTMLAYTAYSAKGDRSVEIINLSTKKRTPLHTNCNNCYEPVWSPNGQYIAYSAFINKNWAIAIIDKDNKNMVIITRDLPSTSGYYSPAFSADSKKIILHNMETVFVMNTTGSVIDKYKISEFKDATGISSSTRFLLSPDETKFIFNSSVNEKGYDYPPNAIFVHQISNKSSLRISPKNFSCFKPILKDGMILFSAVKGHSKITDIYSMGIDGENMQTVFRNCSDFTSKLK